MARILINFVMSKIEKFWIVLAVLCMVVGACTVTIQVQKDNCNSSMRRYKLFDTTTFVEMPSQGKAPTFILRTPSPLDEFQVEVLSVGKEEEIMFISSDIALLFNQQRLMQLSPAILDQLVSNMKQSKPNIKLSDEQLFGALKSRYIQSNADVYAWTRAVQADLDSTISSIEAEAAAQAAKTAEAAAGEDSGE